MAHQDSKIVTFVHSSRQGIILCCALPLCVHYGAPHAILQNAAMVGLDAYIACAFSAPTYPLWGPSLGSRLPRGGGVLSHQLGVNKRGGHSPSSRGLSPVTQLASCIPKRELGSVEVKTTKQNAPQHPKCHRPFFGCGDATALNFVSTCASGPMGARGSHFVCRCICDLTSADPLIAQYTVCHGNQVWDGRNGQSCAFYDI